jgi:four helix bundle protein
VERRSQNAERSAVTDPRAGQPQDLKTRTKAYALRVVRLYVALPKSTEAQVLGRQMLRSGTSVGAHYREAIRARSIAEFVSNMEGGLQELEETAYWLELLAESGIMTLGHLQDLCRETDDLIAIFVSSVNTAKQRRDAER